MPDQPSSDNSVGADIVKAIADSATVLENIKKIEEDLDLPFAVAGLIVNATDTPLIYDPSDSGCDEGGFKDMPTTVIAPQSGGTFGAQSSPFLINGTGGRISYNGPDGLKVTFNWANKPAISNRSDAILVTTNGDTLYRAWSVTGSGGKAKMQYNLYRPSFTLTGAIRDKWQALGGLASFLGPPITNESPASDGIGRYNHFRGSDTSFNKASIYWTPQTNAHEIHGEIRDKWASLGWENSVLGYPTTDESGTPDGVGRFNHFIKGSTEGSIYWRAGKGAFEVHGAIRDKWKSLGWEGSFLGYPITDESGTPDQRGRYNHFEHGSIYWTPQTGAHEVHGLIRDKWQSLGWETSFLGYPTSDEQADTSGPANGRVSYFEHGSIHWSEQTGLVVLKTELGPVKHPVPA